MNLHSADAACTCRSTGPSPRHVTIRRLGVDETAGRYGEVAIWTCQTCSCRWLRYAVRYGYGPVGEKIVVGLIPANLQPINAAAAEAVMNSSPLIFAWIEGSSRPNWTRLAGRVRLGIRR